MLNISRFLKTRKNCTPTIFSHLSTCPIFSHRSFHSKELAYVVGDSSFPLLEDPLYTHFEKQANLHYKNEALVVVHQNLRWTYGQLLEEVDLVANGLRNKRIVKGDRLGIWMPNCAEWLVLQLATAKEGIILVNINPSYKESELESCLDAVGCKAIVFSPEYKTTNYMEMIRNVVPEYDNSPSGDLHCTKLPFLKSLIVSGDDQYKGCINYKDLRQTTSHYVQETLSMEDPINIQFTSGTTGTPKGATLTHKGLLNNGYVIGRKLKFTPKDRVCIPVPLYHCFGMVIGNIACLAHGSTIIYPNPTFDAELSLQACQMEKATALYGVPTMFINQLSLHSFENFDLSHLRTGVMAGSICPIDTMHKVMHTMHMKEVVICYGMTETSPVSFQSEVDDDPEIKSETVGRIHPHLEAKIINEQGEILPRNACGQLLVRGYSVMKGYWDEEEKTKEVLDEDGWMHTGDLASIDDEGYCRILGRIKDVIIRGGENIYPREIEDVLLSLEGVQLAAVVGVRDQKYGEEICAFIILEENASLNSKDIQDHIRKNMAKYKVPRYVQFVNSFPLTVTGKVQKFALQEEAEKVIFEKEPQINSTIRDQKRLDAISGKSSAAE